MAFADRMIGADLNIQWHSAGGTVTLHGDYRSCEYNREMETVDGSAGGDGARAAKATLKKFGATVEVCYTGTAGSATMTRLALGASGTLIVSPQGTATGKPKGGGPMIVKGAPLPVTFDDLVVYTITFEGAGNELYDPFTTVW